MLTSSLFATRSSKRMPITPVEEAETRMARRKEELLQESECEILNFNVAGKTFMVLADTLLGRPLSHQNEMVSLTASRGGSGHQSSHLTKSKSPTPPSQHVLSNNNSMDLDLFQQPKKLHQRRFGEAPVSLLHRFAASTPADRRLLADRYLSDSNAYFFDRNPAAFAAILDYYRDREGAAELHMPPNLCPEKFLDELRFWEVDPGTLSKCCLKRVVLAGVGGSSSGSMKFSSAGIIPAVATTPGSGVYGTVTVDNETASSMVLSIQGPEDPLHPLPTSTADNHQHHQAVATNINNSSSNDLSGVDGIRNGGIVGKKASFSVKGGGSSGGGLLAESNSTDRLSRLAVGDDSGGHHHQNDNGFPSPPPGHPSTAPDMFTGARCGSCRRRCWIFLEDANSSRKARLFSIVSVGFVLLSVLCLVIGSIPECQEPVSSGEPHFSLIIVEYVVIGWFTFEYVIRLLITTQRCVYVKSGLVIIDFIAIFPFYVELTLELAGVNSRSFSNIKGALLVVRTLRVLRVARILRLARYSDGMKSCAETLKASMREIGMLILFVCTMITMFSTTVYFMEKDHPAGQLVASLTSISGVIVLAFPITVIVENFYRYYRKTPAVNSLSTPSNTMNHHNNKLQHSTVNTPRASSPHIPHAFGIV